MSPPAQWTDMFPGPCLGFATLCLVVTVIAAQLPAIKVLEWEKRLFVSLCCGALVNCSIVSWPALSALYEMYQMPGFHSDCSASGLKIVNLQAPSIAVLACGLTCGFFLQDSLIMALYPKETAKELGGAAAYKIMWMHHVVSLFVWPYAMVSSVSSVFVVYFMATEITNIGQNTFLLANRGGFWFKKYDLPIGICWMVSFLIFRVLPVPFVVYWWLVTHVISPSGCWVGVSWAEFFVSFTTIPIPLMLNLFWFYKIVKKASRMIFGKSKPKDL